MNKNSSSNDNDTKGKFIPRILSAAEQEKIRENAALEKEMAEARMSKRAEDREAAEMGGMDKVTLAEFDQQLSDWLRVNEGRHLEGREKAKYVESAGANLGASLQIVPSALMPATVHAEEMVADIED